MTAFGAEELQKLRHASHVVYGSGIGLIGEVVGTPRLVWPTVTRRMRRSEG
jgi:hypothetical protein